MKSLFVSTNYPVDPRLNVHGSFQRMRLFVEALAGKGDLGMLFYVPPEMDVSTSAVAAERLKMQEYWGVDLELHLVHRAPLPSGSSVLRLAREAVWFANQLPYSHTNGGPQAAAFEELSATSDLVFAHRLNVMPAILQSRARTPPVVLDMDDIDHVRRRRSLSQAPSGLFDYLRLSTLPALMAGEFRALRRASMSFVCSEDDRRRLTRTFPGVEVEVVDNAVDLPVPLIRRPARSVVFVGSFNYAPNREAARELIDEVWPLVRREIPDARLRIAGRGAKDLLSEGMEGVELLGFVDDLADLYATAGLMACTIRRGSGTRIKIIEAAAYGVPVVSTTIGAEGLDFEPGLEIVLADSTESFARKCIEMLLDPAAASELAERARRRVEQRYSRRHVQTRIGNLLDRCSDGT